jgi:hypothetical protein
VPDKYPRVVVPRAPSVEDQVLRARADAACAHSRRLVQATRAVLASVAFYRMRRRRMAVGGGDHVARGDGSTRGTSRASILPQ